MLGTRGLEGSFLLLNGDRRGECPIHERSVVIHFSTLLLYVDLSAIMNIIKVLLKLFVSVINTVFVRVIKKNLAGE